MTQHADPPSSPLPRRMAALQTPLFSFARFADPAGGAAHAHIIQVPQAEAYSVIVQLRDFASHKLWRDRRLLYSGGHRRQTMALTDLTHDYACQHLSAFDNARFQLGRRQLDELSEELMGKRLHHLAGAQGAADPVVHSLAQALLPSLRQPAQADAIFVEHVMIALAAHVIRRYGSQGDAVEAAAAGAGMAPWQENRAKEFMASHLTQGLTLEAVASQCGMSRSHFARSFKKRTGMAPFEWLRHERVERAKLLLRTGNVPLTRIAAECGFTDQSHFTRVFTRLVGQGPRAWRTAERG